MSPLVTGKLKFESTPPAPRERAVTRLLKQLKEKPGEWAMVGVYYEAKESISHRKMFAAEGCELAGRSVDGAYQLWARWLPPAPVGVAVQILPDGDHDPIDDIIVGATVRAGGALPVCARHWARGKSVPAVVETRRNGAYCQECFDLMRIDVA